MVYISVAEAAERWQLSERRVQKFARDGRIPGAKKFSGSWAIPEDAARPQDPRKSDGAASPKTQAFLLPMPLMNTAFAPGQAAEAVGGHFGPGLARHCLRGACLFQRPGRDRRSDHRMLP